MQSSPPRETLPPPSLVRKKVPGDEEEECSKKKKKARHVSGAAVKLKLAVVKHAACKTTYHAGEAFVVVMHKMMCVYHCDRRSSEWKQQPVVGLDLATTANDDSVVVDAVSCVRSTARRMWLSVLLKRPAENSGHWSVFRLDLANTEPTCTWKALLVGFPSERIATSIVQVPVTHRNAGSSVLLTNDNSVWNCTQLLAARWSHDFEDDAPIRVAVGPQSALVATKSGKILEFENWDTQLRDGRFQEWIFSRCVPGFGSGSGCKCAIYHTIAGGRFAVIDADGVLWTWGAEGHTSTHSATLGHGLDSDCYGGVYTPTRVHGVWGEEEKVEMIKFGRSWAILYTSDNCLYVASIKTNGMFARAEGIGGEGEDEITDVNVCGDMLLCVVSGNRLYVCDDPCKGVWSHVPSHRADAARIVAAQY